MSKINRRIVEIVFESDIESDESKESDSYSPGNVYIASMNMRGKWAPKPKSNNIEILNVTSAQGKANKNRRDFSPMTQFIESFSSESEIKDGYRGYWNFESFWQSGKVFENIPEKTTKEWWVKCKEAKRRYPKSKDKRVLYSHFDHLPNEKMDYITSRKKVYVPEYFNMIKKREMSLLWRNKIISGKDIVIFDFDGPRLDDGSVTCLKVTPELLKEKINDPHFPFGHGYIVASLLLDINIESYI